MIGVLAAALAGLGAYLLWTATVHGRRGLGRRREARPVRPVSLLERTGLRPGELRRLAVPVSMAAAVSAAVGFVVFGGVLPAVVIGGFAASFPVATVRARRRRQLETAAGAWPTMLEELRLLTGSAGRSIPQALIEVGRRAPGELRPAFALAEREWLLTTDFELMVGVLKESLRDPTADIVAETLLVAYEVGGGLERPLGDLVEDRVLAQQGRKDALTKQAGVRFARLFVLLVPLGMALAGLSIGTGRSAYRTPGGQAAVVVAVLSVVACWLWAGRLLLLPGEPRVFTASAGGRPR